jgi:hypothetical protein
VISADDLKQVHKDILASSKFGVLETINNYLHAVEEILKRARTQKKDN